MCQQRLGLASKSALLTLALLFWIVSGVRADTVVIVGAPQVGSWSLSGSIQNPTSSPIGLFAGPCPPGQFCPDLVQTVTPLGSADLNSFVATTGFGTVYISQAEGETFPLVRANLNNALDFGGSFTYYRSVDIPVVLLSRLISANLSTLNFGDVESYMLTFFCGFGAPCFVEGRSNLVLGNILRTDDKPGEDLPVTLDLFDSGGNLVDSSSLTVPYGQTVVIPVGTPYCCLSLGQLRVTRTGGGALMWGILYTEYGFSGNVSASAGVNLSP